MIIQKSAIPLTIPCTAITQGSVFDEEQWHVKITRLSDLTAQ